GVGRGAPRLVAGRVVDGLVRRPVVISGLVITAIGLGLIGQSGSLAVLLVLSVLSGVGSGLVNPGQQATVADVIGNDRSGGTVLSTFQMFQDGGAILGPVLIGLIADQAGFDWAFAVTGVLALVAVLPWLFAPETHRREALPA
ncbi:MAG: MFS transporter, partial [Nocardioidaceae bacterium]|nr:MFS transporter [Nocardioidaceae bacterium]